MTSHKYILFADYHQFYLQDESVEGDLSDAWTEQAVANLLALAPGTIGVGTVRDLLISLLFFSPLLAWRSGLWQRNGEITALKLRRDA